MNNKGFTLVELLLTIVILGIVLGITIPGYMSVSKAIKSSSRKNLINKIEIAASKYAFDTNKTMIFVDELVSNGYIDSDDENGNILDPVNNGRMNCYIVEMNKESDYYDAKFIDGKNYDNDGICDTDKLIENSEGIDVQVLNNSDIVTNTNNWLKGTVTLSAYSNTLSINCSLNSCIWTSSGGASINGDKITLNNVSGILESKYNFQYTVFDENNSNIKRFNASVNLKIDNEQPVIYNDQITVTNRFINTSTKDVKIVASDGKGSGIVGYFLGITTDSCNSVSIEDDYQTSNEFTVTENGTYTLCVKDKVGNISSSSLTINYIG